jgi:hypothetical protein
VRSTAHSCVDCCAIPPIYHLPAQHHTPPHHTSPHTTMQVFFETIDSQDPLPWVELRMPPNVTVVGFSRYRYQHGHKRPGYFRMRSWQTLTAEVADGPLQELTTRPNFDTCEVAVSSCQQSRPWQVLRLQVGGWIKLPGAGGRGGRWRVLCVLACVLCCVCCACWRVSCAVCAVRAGVCPVLCVWMAVCMEGSECAVCQCG